MDCLEPSRVSPLSVCSWLNAIVSCVFVNFYDFTRYFEQFRQYPQFPYIVNNTVNNLFLRYICGGKWQGAGLQTILSARTRSPHRPHRGKLILYVCEGILFIFFRLASMSDWMFCNRLLVSNKYFKAWLLFIYHRIYSFSYFPGLWEGDADGDGRDQHGERRSHFVGRARRPQTRHPAPTHRYSCFFVNIVDVWVLI